MNENLAAIHKLATILHQRESAGQQVERLARALHEVGIGCPMDAHWRPERHEPEWHDLQASAFAIVLARLSGESE